jgi:hypothetical protein
VNGATVSDYYGGSATLGVAACRPSRVYDFGTFSVFRCPVLYVHTKLLVCGPLERAFHRLIYQRCITACNYISCIFQRRRFRYGATGAANHHRELGFVVHSPCTQDLQNMSLHTFNSPLLYWHAAVLFGFPRQVSQCPGGIALNLSCIAQEFQSRRHGAHNSARAGQDLFALYGYRVLRRLPGISANRKSRLHP